LHGENFMLTNRPGSVTAAGVLAIIYGCLFIVCGLCGVGGLAMQGTQDVFGGGDPQQAQMQKQMKEAMERDIPGLQVTQIAMPIVNLVEAITLLVAGIGLFGMHSWARGLALVGAGTAITTTVLHTVYQIVFVIPAMTGAMAAAIPAAMPKGPGPNPGPAFANVMEAMSPVMGFITAVICIAVVIYLSIIVFLLLRRNVRVAFASARLPPDLQAFAEPDAGDESWRQPGRSENPEDEWRYR
jgi:hypothetical protein